jgi:urease accessory protein
VPLAPRVVPAQVTGWAGVALVQTVGGPLAGDQLDIDVKVGPGARLELFGVAATVALPADRPAHQRVRVHVASGGRLAFRPGPLVLAAGCRLEVALDVLLQPGAAALVEEIVVLGRTGEEPGELHARLRCDLAGGPLLRDEIRIGAAGVHAGPAVLAGARAYGALSLLGVRAPGPLQLEGPGTLARGLAPHTVALRRALAADARAFAGALAASPQAFVAAPAASPPAFAGVPAASPPASAAREEPQNRCMVLSA